MSQTIDSKVVEMRFDNAQFEQNVATSLQTLDKLKQSLNLEKSTKGLENVSAAVKNVDLSDISSGIDALEKRFSTFGIIGMRVIQNLTDSAMRFGKNIIGGAWNTIMTKGKTRAFNIENARFQLQGLLGDAKTVQTVMDNASAAVDGTAYGLDEAAKVASQFAASGVQAGKEMENALLAISGTAAMTNSSYEDIGRIFTTVAGNGRVMADQLNQLSSRGLNAAATLTEYFNKVNDGSQEASDSVKSAIKEITKGSKISEKELRDYVSKGLINFDLFATAMNDSFGEHAKKANLTVLGALSNVKAALGRIGALFYSPLIEQDGPVVKFLNTLRDKINNVKTGLEPIATIVTDLIKKLVTWADTMLKKLDVEGFFKIVNNGVTKLQNGLKKGFKIGDKPVDKALLPIADKLREGFKDARGFTRPLEEGMKTLGIEAPATTDALNAFHDAVTSVVRGDWGNGQARKDKMLAAGLDYSGIQGYVNVLKTCTDEQWTLNDAVWESADAQANVTERIAAMSDEQLKAMGLTDAQVTSLHDAAKAALESGQSIDGVLQDAEKEMGVFQLVGATIANVLSPLIGLFKSIGSAFVEAFPAPTAEQIQGIFLKIYSFSKKLVPTKKTLNSIKSAFSGLFSVVGMVGDALWSIGGAVLPIVFSAFSAVRNAAIGVEGSIGDWLVKLRDFTRKSQVFQKVGNAISRVLKPAVNLATNAFSKFSGVVSGVISKLGDRFITNLPKIGNKLKSFWETIKGTTVYKAVSNAFETVKNSVTDFVNNFNVDEAVDSFLGTVDRIKKGGITAVFDILSEKYNAAVESFPTLVDNAQKAIGSFFTDLNLSESIPATFEEIKTRFTGLWETLKQYPFFQKINEWGEKVKTTLKPVTDRFKTLFESFKQTKVYKKLSKSLDNVKNKWAEFKDALKGGVVFDWLSEQFGSVSDKVKGLWESLQANPVFQKISEGLGRVKAALGTWLDKAIEKFPQTLDNIGAKVTELWNTFKSSPIFEKLGEWGEKAKGAFASFGDWFLDGLENGFDFKVLFDNLSTSIREFFENFSIEDIKASIKSIGDKIKQAFVGIFSKKGENHGQHLGKDITDSLLPIEVDGEAVEDALTTFWGALKQAVSDFIASKGGLVGIFNGIFTSLGKLKFGDVLKGVKLVGIAKIILSVLGIFKGIKRLTKEGGKVLRNVNGTLNDLRDLIKTKQLESESKSFLNAAKGLAIALGALVGAIFVLGIMKPEQLNQGLSAIWKVAAIIAALMIVRGLMKRLAGGGGGGGIADGIAGAVTSPLNNLADGLTAAAKRFATFAGIGFMFAGVGIGVKFLVDALKALMEIPWGTDKVNQAAMALIVMAGGIVTAAMILKGVKGNLTVGAALSIIALAGAIRLLIPAIDEIGDMDASKLVKGLTSIVILLVALGGAMRLAGGKSTIRTAISLIAMVFAVKMLVSAVKSLGEMNPAPLLKGLISVVVLLLAFGGAVRLAGGKNTASTALTLLAMAGAIFVLYQSVKLLSEMDSDALIQGLVATVALLGAFSIAIAIIGKTGDKETRPILSMILMAGAVIILVESVKALANIQTGKLIKGVVAVGALMLAFAFTMKSISKSKMTIKNSLGTLLTMGIMIAALLVVVYAVKEISQLPVYSLIATAALLGVLLLGISKAMAITAAVPLLASLKGLLSFSLWVAGIVGLIELIGWLTTSTKWFGPNAIAAGELIGDVLGSIVHGILDGIVSVTDSLPEAGTNLSEFAANIGPFLDSMSGIGGEAITGIQNLASLISTLSSSSLLDTVNTILQNAFIKDDNDEQIGPMTQKLTDLATGMKVYADTISSATFNTENLKQSYIMGLMISKLNDTLPKTGGWVQSIIGEKDLGTFGWRLVPLALGMSVYASIISNTVFNTERLEASYYMGSMLAALNNSLPETGGKLQDWIGEKDLGTFGWRLIPLALGMSVYASIISNTVFNTERLEASYYMGSMLAALNNSLPETGGVLQDWIGEKDLGTFGWRLIPLALGMSAYATIISNTVFDTDRIDASENMGKMIAALNNSLPATGGALQDFLGEQNLALFGIRMVALAGGMATYANVIGSAKFDMLKITQSYAMGMMIASLNHAIPENTDAVITRITGLKDLAVFGSQLKDLAFGLATYAIIITKAPFDFDLVFKMTIVGLMLAQIDDIVTKASILGGDDKFTNFIDNVPKLGQALTDFANNIDSGIEQSKVDKAVMVARALAEIERLVSGENGQKALFGTFGEQDGELHKFGDGLFYLGTMIKNYSICCTQVDLDTVSKTTGILSELVTAFSADGVTSFKADSFKSFVDELNKIEAFDLTSFIDAIGKSETNVQGAVDKILAIFPNAITDNSAVVTTNTDTMMAAFVKSISNSVDDVGAAAIDNAEELAKGLYIKNDEMPATMSSAIKAVVSAISGFRQRFYNAGSSLAGGLKQGLDSKSSNMSSKITSALQSSVSTIRGYRGKFYNAGVYVVAGFIQGLDSQIRRAQSKINELSSKVAQAMKVSNQIESPSKLYRSFGQYVVQGLILGIDDEVEDAAKASANMASVTLAGFNSAISQVASIVDSGMDFQPTIRPVLDLTELQNGVNQANALFSEKTMELANVVADDLSVKDQFSMADSITEAVKSAINDAMAAAQAQGDIEPYVVEVPVNLDGREVARVTAPFTRSELSRLDVRANRKAGIVG